MNDKPDTFESLKDLTDAVIIDGAATSPSSASGKKTSGPAMPAMGNTPALPATGEEKGDHPGIALLDIAIDESVRYCEREKLPPPNLSLWQNFSRGFLNKSLWHYFPSGVEPESPALCALIGVAGLAVCYIPVIMAFYQKKKDEQAAEDARQIEAHNKKVAQLRAERRARGEEPNTGEPMIPSVPAREVPAPAAAETPQIDSVPSASSRDENWFMTTAQPVPLKIRSKIEAAEPAGPGMT